VLVARSRQRLHQAVDERQRLHRAAQRVADALAARVDLGALTTVVLDTATDIFAADAGSLVFDGELRTVRHVPAGSEHLVPLLDAAESAAWTNSSPYRLESGGAFAVAVPATCDGQVRGVLTLARPTRFTEAEQAALTTFAARVAQASQEVTNYAELRHQAETDPLTGLGNRRRLTGDLEERIATATPRAPLRLTLFDLNNFKTYNDRFGHLAGDALLASLAGQLAAAVAPDGRAYRLGGDEFCVVISADRAEIESAVDALTDRTESLEITPAWGTVVLPAEAATVAEALGLADRRMYQHKRSAARPLRLASQVLTEFLPGS
jgi:diguanylate cyclase (GGDEF)-like protein